MVIKLKGFNSSDGQLLISRMILVRKLTVQTKTVTRTTGPKRWLNIFLNIHKDNDMVRRGRQTTSLSLKPTFSF